MHRMIGIAAVAALVATSAAVAAIAIIKPYAVGVDGGYYSQRLLSVGDTVPESSDASKQYQVVGIPGGLGAHKNTGARSTVFMSHELVYNALRAGGRGTAESRGLRLEVDVRQEGQGALWGACL